MPLCGFHSHQPLAPLRGCSKSVNVPAPYHEYAELTVQFPPHFLHPGVFVFPAHFFRCQHAVRIRRKSLRGIKQASCAQYSIIRHAPETHPATGQDNFPDDEKHQIWATGNNIDGIDLQQGMREIVAGISSNDARRRGLFTGLARQGEDYAHQQGRGAAAHS